MAMESERTFKDSGDDPLPPHKDQINQWIKDGVDLVSLIDQGDVRDVDAVKQYLTCAGNPGCFGKTNIFGQTALLVACRNGQADIVNFLLESGADANVTCNIGNSALHYACQGNEDVVSLCREKPAYPKEKFVEIIKIVELLVHHGASVQMNDDGLSPACVAALNSFKDVVAFFASSNVITMSFAEKVKAYELLGISQAVFDKDHAIDACESFHIAASLQSREDSDVSPNLISPDFDAFFVEMMNKENANEIEKFEIQLKAYLIGIQCLPEKIIDKHNILDAMGETAKAALFSGKAEQDGYEMFVSLIKKEVIDEYPVGTVMEMIKEALEPSLHARGLSFMKLIVKLLETYAEEFRADVNKIRGEVWKIVGHLGGLMFNFAYYHSQTRHLESSFQSVVSIINCIKKMTAEEPDPVTDNWKVSVLSVFIDKLAGAMWEDTYCAESKQTRNRLKFTISRFLHYFGYDPDTDSCLLDNFLQVIQVAYNHSGNLCTTQVRLSVLIAPYDVEWILSVARILIRYGCSTEDASLVASLEGMDEGDPEVAELLQFLSPPTTPLSLEELATRTVLRNNIPFRERLPVALCEKIEGELYLNPDASELDSSTNSDTD